MKDEIEKDTNVIIERKLELSRLINKLPNPKHRTILRMTYINKGTADSICYDLKMSRTTYYRLKKEAISALEKVIWCHSVKVGLIGTARFYISDKMIVSNAEADETPYELRRKPLWGSDTDGSLFF